MATTYQPKPFVLNNGDLQFLLKQVTFKPLFDVSGNAIIAWDGIGAIYDGQGNQLWSGNGTYSTPEAAIAHFGQSYASTTDLSGLRDVSGYNNNLLKVHAAWGSVDQPFTRTVGANFGDYVKPQDAGSPNAYYGNKTFDLNYYAAGNQYTPASNYLTTVNTTADDGNALTADIALGNGKFVHQETVVDYTPRMISRTITTADSTPLLDANNHIVNWNAAQYASDSVYKALINTVVSDANVNTLVEGAAVVTNYVTLLANGGHRDYQKAAGSPGSNEIFIGAENPGVAPTNGWFAIFGQFFDHGLDKIGSGGQGTKIKIALATNDPLYGAIGPDGQPTTSITISRATVSGVDANGAPTYINHTSPFIDQSQTYGSDEQLTQLLREWVSSDGGATYHAGMELFDGVTLAVAWKGHDGVMTNQTLPTLNELRAHLLATGRDDLAWADVLDLRNRDANGDVILSGTGAGSSGQALLLDMNPHFDASHVSAAHLDALNAALLSSSFPTFTTSSLSYGGLIGAGLINPSTNLVNANLPSHLGGGPISLDIQAAVNAAMLDSVGDHYIAGDGRVNENIALTTVHHVFHEEHNFQVQNVIKTIYAQDAKEFAANGSHSGLQAWQGNTGATDAQGNYIYNQGTASTLDDVIAWDQDKMFNAAKVIVEMEYQHAAIDQYARTITPHILEVVGYSSGVNPTVSLEFAQSAFRFGHSTIRETIDTMDPTHGITGQIVSFALQQAFLNPGLYSETGAAAIALGMSHQQMNEVDEFITPALNQGLLGLPLDLAAMNIARGRDLGIPNLNEFRVAVGLTAYVSWDDFGKNMIHPSSLVNFMAAYAFDGDIAKALEIIDRFNFNIPTTSYFTDAQANAIMLNDNSPGSLSVENALIASAFNNIDTWMGGLAEAHVPGGLLGQTFDLVFTNQMESLINGDRFYYLVRLFGQQFSEEVGNGQFKDIVERNTGLEHLNGSILSYADKYYDFTRDSDPNAGGVQSNHAEHGYADLIDLHKNDVNGGATGVGIWSDGHSNPNSLNGNGAIITVGGVQYIRDFRPNLAPNDIHSVEGTPTSGADSHEVMVGTDFADYVHMRGGDDTFYGEGGNDKIFGDVGNDRLYGGAGDDIIDSGDGADLVDGGDGDDIIYGYGSGTEIGGFDQLVGGSGNDIIYGGEGVDKLSGGAGDDALYGEGNTDPFTHGGDGNDYIDGGTSGDNLYGDDGDDFVYGGDDQDIVQGDKGDDILKPGKPSQAINGGPDEVIGGNGYTDTGFDIMDLSDYDLATTGVNADLTTQANPLVAIDNTTPFPAWFQIEGVVATRNNDTLIGTDAVGAAGEVNLYDGSNWLIGGSGNDTFTGAGGNDIIVGGSIRLDSLIGTYSGGYTNSVDGATHRAIGPLGTNGLLDTAGMGDQKHFVEFLKTNLFKDHVLGDGGADGTSDKVIFTGNRSDYTVERIFFNSANEGLITAYVITDTRNPNGVDANGQPIATDGTDIVTGVELFQFADGTLTADNLFNVRPDGTLAFTVVENPGGVVSSNNAVRLNPASSLLDTDNISASNIYGAVTAGITYSWMTTSNIPLSSSTSANPYVDAAGRLVLHTTTGTIVREQAAYVDAHNNSEIVIKDWNMVVGTSNTDNPLNGTSNSDAIFGLGNSQGNNSGSEILNGLAGDDRLYGGSGNDTLNGGADNDYLDGGTGSDNLRGGSGNDLYVVNSNNDTVDERVYTGNNATNNSDAGGTDTVLSSIDYSLAASTLTGNDSRGLIENLTLTGNANLDGTGNALDNVITGNNGDNVLTGAAGNDKLIGGDGNDTLIGGTGNDTLDGGNGVDTASYVDATTGVTVSLTAAGAQNTVGAGTDTLVSIENLTGSNQADTLTGNASANVLSGGGGNDTLNGAGGTDTLVGGTGNDTYIVNNVGVTITENNNAGTDTVLSSIDTTLTNNVENLTLTGSGNISGTGNSSNNVIIGNTGNNVLSGGAGQDTITGGAGADIISGGTGQDTLTGGAGKDIYVFTTTAEASTNLNVPSPPPLIDIITDFATFAAAGANSDIIDLSAIDAIQGPSNQTFTFNGTGTFTAPGQLRYVQIGADTFIQGNVGGTTAADFSIQLSGLHVLGAADFVL